MKNQISKQNKVVTCNKINVSIANVFGNQIKKLFVYLLYTELQLN